MPDSFGTDSRRILAKLRSLLDFLSRESRGDLPSVARLRSVFPSVSSNNQNDPEYLQHDPDVYPEGYPTEISESDEREREWEGDVYMGKGVPDPDFKWGACEGRVDVLTPRQVLGRRVFAETPSEITTGLERGVRRRSGDVRISDKKYRKRLSLWTVKATSGGPTYTVKIKGLDPDGPFRGDAFWETDVEVTCSCPYWRWNGPEYHAEKGNYLKGSPRGTASVPDIQDPQGNSYVCKHVLKAFEDIRDSEVGKRRKRTR